MTGPDDTYGDKALAAEYVLRLLDQHAHRAFEARLRDEPELRALVLDWEQQLATLAEDIAEETPPAHLRGAVLKTVATDPAAASRRGWFTGLWARVLGGGLLAAVAITLAVVVFDRQEEQGPSYRADLISADQSISLMVRSGETSDALQVEVAAGSPPDGRVFELWLIAEDAAGPVSLGVLNASALTSIQVPEALLAGLATGTLAISDEPPGGSPTGSPTGTVLAAGQVQKI
ncbi:anti-sigma factor domain-containing protein [Tritonibacter scottomollicae]|uniref:anti-sigma factor n=1 Tax=Tritonibacter scottomollicae TaxID=483013 RepID=UPI003AA7B1FD